MINPMSLSGRRILVTGASSGIGAACAQVAAELDATVILVARRLDKLQEVRGGLPNKERHEVLACDLSDRSSIAGMISRAVVGGKLNGVVHAAGIGPMMPIGLLSEEHIESVFRTNYFSFLELVKNCTKISVRGSQMSIVAVSSISAFAGWSGISVYSGSKGALSATVRSMAMELAPKKIRVNAVCPSNIKTPMFDSVVGDLNTEESIAKIIAKQPLGLGEPRQVANAVSFLLSDAASFITGVNLPVDGGYLAQ